MTNYKKYIVAVLAVSFVGAACKTTDSGEVQPTTAPTAEAVETEGTAETETATEPAEDADPLRAAVDSPARPEEERARDQYRHPYETLKFFGVEPHHSVLELWSGAGWYTRVLAPYLAPEGKLYVTAYPADVESDYLRRGRKKVDDYLAAQGYGEAVEVIDIDTEALDFGLDGQVDFVLTFRNLHNWVKAGFDKKVYEQAFKALKPGGVLGVVEHRKDGASREEAAKSGYMDTKQVIADIEAVGFEFVEASEVNANPRDTKDHPEGVWTLPPALRLGDQDRDKYVAIGESDRMTLKFVKPAATN